MPWRTWMEFPDVSIVVIGVFPLADVVIAPDGVRYRGAPKRAEKSPARSATVGTVEVATRPISCRVPW